MRQGRRREPARKSCGWRARSSRAQGARHDGVEDVDLAAFRKAGEKAYEALELTEVKNAVHKEIGKK